MTNRCLVFLLLLANFRVPLPGQSASCGHRQLSEQQDSATKLRMAKVLRGLDSLGRHKHIVPRNEIYIPVVVHIVWQKAEENISDERVLSQIAALNRDFNGENADLSSVPNEFETFVSKKGIRFCLAATDPQGEPTSGILRVKTNVASIGTKGALYSTADGGSNAWDTRRYLNIWVADLGVFLTGFGAYPGQVSPDRDGLVIHPAYFGANNTQRYGLGRVAVHEAGHFFGLLHPWGDDEDCATDDGVADTPPQFAPYLGCPAHPQESCNTADMFMNFMDYVDDDCMVMFTKGQMDRVWNTLVHWRSELSAAVIPCVRVEQGESDIAFAIRPNPSFGSVRVVFAREISRAGTVEVFNQLGRRVYQKTTVLFDGMHIDLQETKPGIYWMKIGNRVEKLIIF